MNLDGWHNRIERADNATQRLSLWQAWKKRDDVPVPAFLELAGRFADVGRATLEIQVLERGRELWPRDTQIAHRLGWALRRAGRLDEAEAALQAVLDIEADHVDALGILGGIRKRQGHLAEARPLYARAHEVDETDRYPLVNLGALDAIEARLDSDSGRDWYRRIVDILTGEGRRPREDWDEFCLAEAYVVLGQADDAARVLGSAIQHARPEVLRSAADQLEFLASHGVQPDACERMLEDYLLPALGQAGRVPGPVLFHVSDLHFGRNKDGREMHRFLDQRDTPLLAEHLVEEMRAATEAQERRVLVVSGDIGYMAQDDEYADALVQLRRVRDELALDIERVVVVPGNHDVNWALSQADHAARMTAYTRFVSELYGEARKKLYPHMVWDRPGIDRYPELPLDLLAVHDLSASLGVVIVGLNSCVEESHARHYGFVDPRQIKRIEKAFDTAERPGAIRVVVMHHHLLPLADSVSFREEGAAFDVTLVRNGGLIEKRLHEAGVDIVLHGHKHAAALRESIVYDDSIDNPKRLVVSSAGSTSVSPLELVPGWGNHLAWLDLHGQRRIPNRPFLTVQWRALSPTDPKRWTAQGPPRKLLG